MIAGLAAQKYGKALDHEQEILVNIADIVSQVYAMEAAICVLKKPSRQPGKTKRPENSLYADFCTSCLSGN